VLVVIKEPITQVCGVCAGNGCSTCQGSGEETVALEHWRCTSCGAEGDNDPGEECPSCGAGNRQVVDAMPSDDPDYCEEPDCDPACLEDYANDF